MLPYGQISHSTRPGRTSSPADKAVTAEGAASPSPLHMFGEIASSAYQHGTFTFPPTLPLFHPPSHLALSHGSSLNYLNYILLLLLGSPNVSHPAISGTFSLYQTAKKHSCSFLLPELPNLSLAQTLEKTWVEIVTWCVEGTAMRVTTQIRKRPRFYEHGGKHKSSILRAQIKMSRVWVCVRVCV